MTSSRHLVAALAVSVVWCETVAASPHDPDASERAFAWTLTSIEVSVIPLVLLLPSGVMKEDIGNLVAVTPLLIGAGVGVASYFGGWEPRVPLAVHGGLMTGLELGLVGALIDGAANETGPHVGTTAIVLGAIGALGGAAYGATMVGPELETVFWLLSPAGALAGGLFGALAILIDPGMSDRSTGTVLGLSTLIGLSASLGVAFGVTASGDRHFHRRQAVVDNLALSLIPDPARAGAAIALSGSF